MKESSEGPDRVVDEDVKPTPFFPPVLRRDAATPVYVRLNLLPAAFVDSGLLPFGSPTPPLSVRYKRLQCYKGMKNDVAILLNNCVREIWRENKRKSQYV